MQNIDLNQQESYILVRHPVDYGQNRILLSQSTQTFV